MSTQVTSELAPTDALACILSQARSRIGVSRSHRVDELDRITEGRYTYKHPKYGWYAWCGDFASYLLEMCGCSDPTALNRISVAGKWTPGDNISRIMRWAKSHGASFTDPARLKAGHYYVKPAANGDHIGVVSEVMETGYKTIDGNGWKGAVSEGSRTFESSLRTFIDTTRFLGDGVIFIPPGQGNFEVPPWWPADILIGLPLMPALDGDHGDPETQANDTFEFGPSEKEEKCT